MRVGLNLGLVFDEVVSFQADLVEHHSHAVVVLDRLLQGSKFLPCNFNLFAGFYEQRILCSENSNQSEHNFSLHVRFSTQPLNLVHQRSFLLKQLKLILLARLSSSNFGFLKNVQIIVNENHIIVVYRHTVIFLSELCLGKSVFLDSLTS